jgi:hypothetical protein
VSDEFATREALRVPFIVNAVVESSPAIYVPAIVTTCPLDLTRVATAGIATIRADTVRTFVPEFQFVIV